MKTWCITDPYDRIRASDSHDRRGIPHLSACVAQDFAGHLQPIPTTMQHPCHRRVALRLPFAASLAAACLFGTLSAQKSTAKVFLGDKGSFGCQNKLDPPILTNGVRASAEFAFAYDSAKKQLTLAVTNTSPIVKGESNPLLTRIYFNLPHGSVSSVKLLSQKGSGSAKLAFGLAVDTDQIKSPNPLKVACFGNFGVALTNGGGVSGGIANAKASVFSGPKDAWVKGPVQFVLALDGPGASLLTASAIANSFSQNASYKQVTASAKFMGGGLAGAESGFLSSSFGCAGGVYVVGTPSIGNNIDICSTAAAGCHGCLLVSLRPGPSQFGNMTIPIGFPILTALSFPLFPANNVICVPLAIPEKQSLIGTKIYFTLATLDLKSTTIGFSPRFDLTIQK